MTNDSVKRIILVMADHAARSAPPTVIGVGFLLSQLGAHSAFTYAKRIAPLGLLPPHVGVLRAIGELPGRSQQTIADEFGLPPSRMVGFIDELETRGLVERRRDARDRRVHLLHLTGAGEEMLAELAAVARASERELLAALSATERHQLAEFLTRIADDQGLTRGVHPGYGRMRNDREAPACPTTDA
jgi:DNA-binding MarR family transcriptional regulator